MNSNQCKKCRRIGEKLFLKGERCFGPKCTLTRKPYAPGIVKTRGGRRRPKALSEYGVQLKEKQEIKHTYGIRNKQYLNYLKEASKTGKGDTQIRLFELLESRLDNIIFRSGFTNSRGTARQIVSHGHIIMNGRKVNIPSCQTKIGDIVTIKPRSIEKGIFKDIDIKLKKFTSPSWIKLDKEKKQFEIIGIPNV